MRVTKPFATEERPRSVDAEGCPDQLSQGPGGFAQRPGQVGRAGSQRDLRREGAAHRPRQRGKDLADCLEDLGARCDVLAHGDRKHDGGCGALARGPHPFIDRKIRAEIQDGKAHATRRGGEGQGAQLVPSVEDFSAIGELRIGHATSPLGSGGMRSKVVAAEMATAGGIETVICSGLRDGALAAALDGAPAGTRFPARDARYSSFKLWLKYAKPSRGTVVVDAGAARALRDGGTSLLPVGVTEVRGTFDAGDAVQVAHGAIVIGKGICNYSADELTKVKGMQSAE